MRSITEAGHIKPVRCRFRPAHAAGNLEMHLHDWDVDFAAGARTNISTAAREPSAVRSFTSGTREVFDLPRFAGWWGHDKETRFLMGPDFNQWPELKAGRFQIRRYCKWRHCVRRSRYSTQAGMSDLRAKSEKLTGYLEYLMTRRSATSEFR